MSYHAKGSVNLGSGGLRFCSDKLKLDCDELGVPMCALSLNRVAKLSSDKHPGSFIRNEHRDRVCGVRIVTLLSNNNGKHAFCISEDLRRD